MILIRRFTKLLKAALVERDAYTKEHSDRVAMMAMDLGNYCKFSHLDLDLLHQSAEMHDVGKIGIPDNVLLKEGRLSDEEWDVMKTHAEVGQRICKEMHHDAAEILGLIVRNHHESFDGTGYPDGLSGESIPIQARIISITDSYDAMCTVRPYRSAYTHTEAIHMLEKGRGSKYDPYLLEGFLKIISNSPYRAAG